MRSTQTNAFYYAAIVTLGGLVFGLDIGVIAGTLSYISAEFGLTDIQLGTVGAAPGFGAIFALLLAGPICNRIGRKRSIQLIALLYLVSAVASAHRAKLCIFGGRALPGRSRILFAFAGLDVHR